MEKLGGGAKGGGGGGTKVASQEGHHKVVKLLLSNGASVHDKSDGGARSLHVASQYGHLEVVKLLLSKGASVHDKSDGGYGPLYVASQNGHLEVVKLLLSMGAGIYDRSSDGSTCFTVTTSNEAKYPLDNWVMTMLVIVLQELRVLGGLLIPSLSSIFNNTWDTSVPDFGALKERAKTSIAAKHYAEAADMYSRCIDMANSGGSQFSGAEDIKELAIIYANRCLCYSFLEDQLQNAISDADKAIQLNPQYLESYNRKADVLMKLGLLAEAKQASDMSLAIKADDADSISTSNKINESTVIKKFRLSINPSWTTQLKMDPDTEAESSKRVPAPNTTQRQVKSGHFVPVSPTPLPNPQLITFTPSVAESLGFNEQFCVESPVFKEFFAGYMDAIPTGQRSFATGYALSIYGEKVFTNCPFENGNGYGDGRAISVAEIVNPVSGQRLEMQLKGSGGTPYRRGGDGRATLRSSVREFLGSEAMHNLGISTTRPLSLVFSQTEHVTRPSYTGDRRITSDMCAISCRVAPSFVRVGHIELFARRYDDAMWFNDPNVDTIRDELRLIVEHAMFREFGGPVPSPPNAPKALFDTPEFKDRVLSFLRESSRRICDLTAEWIRVGFCQGNFNSDNCLIAGRTMDYGPFGFIERYNRRWNMWKDSGDHFSFRNQPTAGERNFFSLIKSVELLLGEGLKEECKRILSAHAANAEAAVNNVFRQKLGLQSWTKESSEMFKRLDDLIEELEVDYTLFWRQLSLLPEQILVDSSSDPFECSDEMVLSNLKNCFYKEVRLEKSRQLKAILCEWLNILKSELMASESNLAGNTTPIGVKSARVSSQMRLVSPKYVPREWMLEEAYKQAEKLNFEPLKVLQQVFARPYDEKMEYHDKFYRMRPGDKEHSGISCMT